MRTIFAAYWVVYPRGSYWVDRGRVDRPLKRFLHQNSLTVFFLVIFLVTVAAQSQAGWRLYRDDQHTHHQPAVSYQRYLVTSRFSAEVMENWQSEFLQFTLYILATVWLVQKGSNESKQEGESGVRGTRSSSSGDTPTPTQRAGHASAGGARRSTRTRSSSP
jgi:hypothetical protein